MSDLEQILSKYTCGDFLNSNSEVFKETIHYSRGPAVPIYIDSKESIQDACKTLYDNKISSAPILDKSQMKFIGQIDYFDLITHVMHVLNDIPIPDRHTSDFTLVQILEKASKAGHPLESLEKHRPLVLVSKQSTLLQIVNHFINTKAHRVAVLDDHTFIGVVSQSAVAALVVSKFGLRGDKKTVWPNGEKTLEEAGIIEKNVISVPGSATVMQALFEMHVNDISSVALLNGKKLAGTISMSDIKVILMERNGWRQLFDRCDDFFKSLRNRQSLEHDGKAILPIFTVSPDTKVITAMEKMVATRTHRIWVLSSTEDVIGLVPLSAMVPLLL